MTANEQKRYAKWARAEQRRRERRAYVIARTALQRGLQTVAELVRSTRPENWADVPDAGVSEEDTRELFRRIYDATGPSAAQQSYDEVSARAVVRLKRAGDPLVSVGFFSQKWRALMLLIMADEETARRVASVTEAIRQKIRSILTAATEARLTVRQAASLLNQQLGGAVLRRRALTIARTETTRAASLGAELGAVETGLQLQKLWIATADSRTRASHRRMLGSKPIGKDEKFQVGRARMLYPGDPAGGAKECVNCRCTVAYVPLMVNAMPVLAQRPNRRTPARQLAFTETQT